MWGAKQAKSSDQAVKCLLAGFAERKEEKMKNKQRKHADLLQASKKAGRKQTDQEVCYSAAKRTSCVATAPLRACGPPHGTALATALATAFYATENVQRVFPGPKRNAGVVLPLIQ